MGDGFSARTLEGWVDKRVQGFSTLGMKHWNAHICMKTVVLCDNFNGIQFSIGMPVHRVHEWPPNRKRATQLYAEVYNQ